MFLHWSVLVVMGGCLAMAVSDPIVAIVTVVSYFGVMLIHELGHAPERIHVILSTSDPQ